MGANIKDDGHLLVTVSEINKYREDIKELTTQIINKKNMLVEETSDEKRNSYILLEEAKRIELLKKVEVEKIELQLAMAIDEVEIAILMSKLAKAEAEYKKAKIHRIAMENRYEMAQSAYVKAVNMYEKLVENFNFNNNNIDNISEVQCARLKKMYEILKKYYNEEMPQFKINKTNNIKLVNENSDNLKKPLTPDKINEELNFASEEIKFILKRKCTMDENFRNQIQNLKNDDKLEEKVKKNVAGAAAEEMVKYVFSKYGKVSTQKREVFDDGKYTKIDLVVENLKLPVILGKGKGNGVQVGGSIAIEVKSGHSAYLCSQKEHMVFQAAGHQNSDISCVICTRDIKNVSEEKNAEIRNELREAGSPLLGMLPYKDEIDKACIEFVKEELNEL